MYESFKSSLFLEEAHAGSRCKDSTLQHIDTRDCHSKAVGKSFMNDFPTASIDI